MSDYLRLRREKDNLTNLSRLYYNRMFEKRPYVCPRSNCKKTYTTRFSLKRHLASHNSKNFVCHVCGKKFALSQYLKEHSYTHTGQKPFVCEFPGCYRQFRQAGKLSMHKKIHRNILFRIHKVKKTDKKPNDCQISSNQSST